MSILKAKIRETNTKGKQLRRKGIIPAVLYGKHLKESVNIQIPKGDVDQFLKANAIGSKLELTVGRKKYMALLKEVDYNPLINQVEHLSFLEMKAGEKVTSVSQIVILNKEKTDGIVQQTLEELSYRSLPKDIVEKIEIDVDGMSTGDSIMVSELDISKNEAIEILTAPDIVVLTVTARKEIRIEETENNTVNATTDEEAKADTAE